MSHKHFFFPKHIRSRLLEFCLECEHHEAVQRERVVSYCKLENCYSENSDCVLDKALDEFLERNEVKSIHIINKALHGRS